MNTVLWIAQLSLAGVFLATGSIKLFLSRERLIALMGDWPESFSPSFIKALATAELLGAVGLVIPWWVDILPVLTPLAAGGLVAVMVGATATHMKRGETPNAVFALALIAVLGFIALGRWP